MGSLSLEAKQKINKLLDDLPAASLTLVEQFVEFVHEQARQGKPLAAAPDHAPTPYRYPTVPLSPGVLDGLVGLMPPVGGNALAETEALYDEA